MRFKLLTAIPTAVTVGLALAATPAFAEVSSVDAYGGQAAVLGAPRAHRHTGGDSNLGSGTKSNSGTPTGGAGPSQGPPSSSNGVSATQHGGAAANRGVPGVGVGGTSLSSKGGTAGQQTTAGPQTGLTHKAYASASDGSLPLSGVDLLVLVAVLACLLGAGVLMRRVGRQPQ
jgi:hypothetical protein